MIATARISANTIRPTTAVPRRQKSPTSRRHGASRAVEGGRKAKDRLATSLICSSFALALIPQAAIVGIDRNLILPRETSRVTQQEPKAGVLRSSIGGPIGIHGRGRVIVSLQRLLCSARIASYFNSGTPSD
jgi:hypothetical protein